MPVRSLKRLLQCPWFTLTHSFIQSSTLCRRAASEPRQIWLSQLWKRRCLWERFWIDSRVSVSTDDLFNYVNRGGWSQRLGWMPRFATVQIEDSNISRGCQWVTSSCSLSLSWLRWRSKSCHSEGNLIDHWWFDWWCWNWNSLGHRSSLFGYQSFSNR
jgi:hypothetical protein